MARCDTILATELSALPAKPPDTAKQGLKKNWSEALSNAFARAVAEELRQRGLSGTRPDPTGGAERRMAGGLGAKKVDVTWATEESGLLMAVSVKTINFVDRKTGNYQKNLNNRRGDMLFEATTLHRRSPYAVLGGYFILDAGAAKDDTARRRSTFENAHARLRLFTGRDDPAGRDEQYERIWIVLADASSNPMTYRCYPVPDRAADVPLGATFDDLVSLIAERNPDFYEDAGGTIVRVT